MLSEPKKKVRWSLNPRGSTSWSSDDTKLGQKLLEKMGWEKGKGLGKNEDGNPDPIKVTNKQNAKGLGFKGYDDVWIEHRECFDSLLSELNQDAPAASANSVQLQSLEKRSQISKKRIHKYQKLVRGKDLSSFSDNDLKCIFGKAPDQSFGEESVQQSDVLETSDYQKGRRVMNETGGDDSNAFKKKKSKKQKCNGYQEETSETGGDDSSTCKNKKKKRKCNDYQEETSVTGETGGDDSSTCKKKKKKRKCNDYQEETSVTGETGGDDSSTCKKKKKKKRKCNDYQEETSVISETGEDDSNCFKKDKKRKYLISEHEVEFNDDVSLQNEETETLQNKQNKKLKKKIRKEEIANGKETELTVAIVQQSNEVDSTDFYEETCRISLECGDENSSFKKRNKKRKRNGYAEELNYDPLMSTEPDTEEQKVNFVNTDSFQDLETETLQKKKMNKSKKKRLQQEMLENKKEMEPVEISPIDTNVNTDYLNKDTEVNAEVMKKKKLKRKYCEASGVDMEGRNLDVSVNADGCQKAETLVVEEITGEENSKTLVDVTNEATNQKVPVVKRKSRVICIIEEPGSYSEAEDNKNNESGEQINDSVKNVFRQQCSSSRGRQRGSLSRGGQSGSFFRFGQREVFRGGQKGSSSRGFRGRGTFTRKKPYNPSSKLKPEEIRTMAESLKGLEVFQKSNFFQVDGYAHST